MFSECGLGSVPSTLEGSKVENVDRFSYHCAFPLDQSTPTTAKRASSCGSKKPEKLQAYTTVLAFSCHVAGQFGCAAGVGIGGQGGSGGGGSGRHVQLSQGMDFVQVRPPPGATAGQPRPVQQQGLPGAAAQPAETGHFLAFHHSSAGGGAQPNPTPGWTP
jgi:hypothetical protein